MKYNKLVRDNIPKIVEKQGKECVYRILRDEEYHEMLNKKMIEEMYEFIDDESIEELADIVEVISAIMKEKGYTEADLRREISNKREKRGGFNKKILLLEIKE